MKGVSLLSKKNRRQHKPWELKGTNNRHHDIAKCKGGTWDTQNIFIWDVGVHEAFHWIFSNRTLEEAAEFLLKMRDDKNNGINPDPTWGIKNREDTN